MKASRNNFHAAGFGKVAPWVDLANSEEWNGFGKLTDHLTNAPWLATFLKHWNLHPLTSKDVPRRKLLQLRALLRCRADESADLKLGILPAHEREKLVSGLLIVTESAEHGASDGLPMLLFHSAHLHAEMAGFDNHADTLRSDFFLDGLGDLAGKALLNLQAAREHVDHAGDLAEP